MATRKTTFVQDEQPKEVEKTIEELRQEAVDGVFQIAQFGCLTFGSFADAGAIGLHGPRVGKEIVAFANQNKAFASKLDLLIDKGPIAGIIAAGLPLVLQILVNHGIFKPEQLANAGVVSPDSLESQMKTQVMRQSIEALAAQKQAEEELREMAERLNKAENEPDVTVQENWEKVAQ